MLTGTAHPTLPTGGSTVMKTFDVHDRGCGVVDREVRSKKHAGRPDGLLRVIEHAHPIMSVIEFVEAVGVRAFASAYPVDDL